MITPVMVTFIQLKKEMKHWINLKIFKVEVKNQHNLPQEPFFKLPVLVAPTVWDTVVPTHVISSLVVTVNNDQEPVL
jgi:hypothetical protein